VLEHPPPIDLILWLGLVRLCLGVHQNANLQYNLNKRCIQLVDFTHTVLI
jgi:hypothetical protein